MNPQTYPTFADYQSALQHPEMAFSSNFLSKGLVESDLWGFPRVRSGGFALTYKIALREMTWAARCFHKVVRDRAIRYAQICQSLEEFQLPFFVPTRYIPHGIVVQGKQFPISVLQWVDGDSLETYIFHHLNDPEILFSLGKEFRAICKTMETFNIAHGDLSHRNILVKSGEIYLIDYDGMFVPSLAGRKSSELGNIHFQHPLRNTTFFDNHLDRFSSIVIYLSIMAIAADSSLWQRFQSGGEGLLFQRSDFLDPQHSRLMKVLENNPATSRYIPRFQEICLSQIESVPSLEEIILNNSSSMLTKTGILDFTNTIPPRLPIIAASEKEEIFRAEGEITTIIGRISEVFHGHTLHGDDHVFINFGDWQEKCFTAILWGTLLDDSLRLDLSLDSWVGQWMSVTGLITSRNLRPQIQVEAITDLVLLPSEEDAKRLLQCTIKTPAVRKYKKVPVFVQSATSSINKATQENSLPSTGTSVVNLTEIFDAHPNVSIESALNQLYAPERFKKNTK